MKIITYIQLLIVGGSISLFLGCESAKVQEPDSKVSTVGSTSTNMVVQPSTNAVPTTHAVYDAGQVQTTTTTNKLYTPPPAKPRTKKTVDQSGKIAVGLRTSKPGYVISPYAMYDEPIDVSGLPSGTEVKCPYTGKIFIVP